MGERTPHLDPDARGALVGITAQHSRAHVIRAILEGVAFSLRDSLTLFKEIGVPIESIRLGAEARDPLCGKRSIRYLRMPVELIEAEEGGAYGAALLAGVGVGAWPTGRNQRARPSSALPRPFGQNPKTVSLMNLQYARVPQAVIQHSREFDTKFLARGPTGRQVPS